MEECGGMEERMEERGGMEKRGAMEERPYCFIDTICATPLGTLDRDFPELDTAIPTSTD